MNILIAPDSFKDALPAPEVAQAIEQGLLSVAPQLNTRLFPLADGGEGTIAVLQHHLTMHLKELEVHDPLFRKITASYAHSANSRTALIEMAAASGLERLAVAERNPLPATSLGTGELIAEALNQGAREILLAIGGSATNDAGMGMARALGYRFFNSKGSELPGRAADLIAIHKVDTSLVHTALHDAHVRVLCDVDNPLFGPQGAAHVYAGQKGASQADIDRLDNGLRHFANIARQRFGREVATLPGGGAAGGLGAGAVVFCNAKLCKGIDVVMELSQFEAAVEWADAIVAAEGRIDEQSLQGKVIQGICEMAAQKRVPVWALCGALDLKADQLKWPALQGAFAIGEAFEPLEQALLHTAKNLQLAARQLANLLVNGQGA